MFENKSRDVKKWYIVKSVPSCSNITKSCMLCLHEMSEILTYRNQDELLNKRSELVSTCRHINKYLCPTIKLMIDIPFNTFHVIA